MIKNIVVNKKVILAYDFSFLKSSLESISNPISIEMCRLGYALPRVLPKGSIIISPDGPNSICCDPNNIYFESVENANADEIKQILDNVKKSYIKLGI